MCVVRVLERRWLVCECNKAGCVPRLRLQSEEGVAKSEEGFECVYPLDGESVAI